MKTAVNTAFGAFGGDYEVANWMVGLPGGGHPERASQLLLDAVPGVPGIRRPWPVAVGPQSRYVTCEQWLPIDWGRKYLPEIGGCCYVDSDHLEIAFGEVRGAMDFLLMHRAMLEVVDRARKEVNQGLPPGQKVRVCLNNTDGHGRVSYGTHRSLLCTRQLFQKVIHDSPRHTQFAASLHAALMLLGQGKVGADNGAPPVHFQWSARADFCRHVLISEETMVSRPLINSRDESLCGGNRGLARMHVICHDHNLSQVNTVLLAGMLQIGYAMLEADVIPVDALLARPLEASVRISHDPLLEGLVEMENGRRVTSASLLEILLRNACAFAEKGMLDGLVPGWEQIFQLWEDVVSLLYRRDYEALARKLDGFCKLQIMAQAMEARADLSWASPELKMLDQLYGALGEDGIFLQLESIGAVEKLAGEEELRRFHHSAPEDTRAGVRAKLLRLIPRQRVLHVDWDRVVFDLGKTEAQLVRMIPLPDPLAGLDAMPAVAQSETFQELIDALGLAPAGSA